MKNHLAIALLVALGSVAPVASLAAIQAPATPAAPAASAAPVATPSPDAASLARAKEWIGRVQSGKIDRTQLTDQMSDLFTPAAITKLSNQLGPFGAPTKLEQTAVQDKGGNMFHQYTVTFTNGSTLIYVFAVDDATGKISGLRFVPTE